MDFKHAYLRKEYTLVCPYVRDLAQELSDWLKSKDYAAMMITHVFRTDKQQEEWYWKSKYAKLAGTSQYTEEHARELARKSFSWHKVYCAIDIRNTVYTPSQKKDILGFLRKGRTDSRWEIYSHDVGQGPHFHVGYEDFAWRRKWEQALKA